METRPCMARAVAVSGVMCVNKMDPGVQLQRFFNPRHYIFRFVGPEQLCNGKKEHEHCFTISYIDQTL
jgi:hypothetical protein